jgi:hypothetical protein
MGIDKVDNHVQSSLRLVHMHEMTCVVNDPKLEATHCLDIATH